MLDCTGPSYVVTDGGVSEDELLAYPAAIMAKRPGGVLSTIEAGCLAGSTSGTSVVIAFGPYPDAATACQALGSLPAGKLTTLEGSATAGLTEKLCG